MADKVTSLYNALKADGLFKQARSLNDFKAKMAYQGYRSQIYKLARDKGANVGTFSQFTNALGYSSGSPKPRQSYGSYHTQQQKPAENKAMTTAQRAMQVAQEYQQNHQPTDYLHRPQNQMGRARRNAPGKASPFVQSLYEIDNAQKGPDYSVDYTSPKATQQVYQQNQQLRRQAAKTAGDHIVNDEYRRQSQPMIDNGTVGVMKPMGEIEQEMSDSASRFVDANLGDYINKAVLGEQNAAGKRAVDAYNNSFAAGGGGGGGINDLLMRSLAYNEENDPDKMIENLANNARGGLEKLFQNPSFVAKVKNEADMLGVTPDAYVESMLPHLKDRLSAALEKSEYNKYLPKDAFENMANRFIDSNTIGKLVRGATMTRGQRIMQERASAATAAGENPYYKGSTVENVVADVAGMVSDPVFKGAAGAGGKVAGKLIGNSTKLSALMANGNLAQRLMAKGAQVVTSGGVTGFVFDSTGSVIQNYSTGEDTSLGNTLKVAAKGGTTGAVNFATMSLAGIPLSEVGRSIGLKAVKGGSFWGNTGRATAKIGLESGKTYMEAMGMYLGGYVSGKLEGRTDANGKPIEFDLWNGTMESLPTAIGFRLQHAVEGLRGGRKNEKGEDMGWFGSTIANFKDFLTSDKAKESRFLMTDDERNQIFSSGAMNGLMPDGENIVSYAKRTKNKKVSYEDPYLETDASMIKNTYDQIMADPKVSWDAKAKFSAMVTGIMPSARPMMDYITYSSEDYVKDGLLRGKRKYVNEYSAKGELLSKIPYDSKVDRDNVVYKHNIVRENQRLYNAMGLLARQDRNNYELQNDFFVENMKKPGTDVNILVTNMGDEGSHVFRDFSLFALNSEKGTVLKTIDSVAVRNGMKSEDLIKAMKKNPMKRSDFEQNVCVELRRALEAKAFPDGKVHVEQSNLNGKDVAEDNNLGTEQPNGDAVKQELNGLRQAEEEVEVLMRDNDVFSQNFKKLQSQGLTNPQIYDWMVQQGGLTVEQLEPFAHYINANARVQGMQEATKQKIENVASSFVQDWSYKDTLNGVGMVNADGSAETVLFVYHDGKELIVGSGDVSFNQPNEYGIRRAKEDVGDMLVCFDPQTGQMVYVHASEVDYSREMKPEELKTQKILELQNINSVPYNEAAQEQAMLDAAENQDQSESGKGNDASETPEIVSEATPVETPTDFSFNNGKGRIKSYKATPHEKTKSDGTKEITFSSEVTYTKGAPKGHKEGEVRNIGNGGGFIKIDPIDIDYQQYAVYGRLHDDGTAFSKDEATSEDIAWAKELIDTLLTPQLAEEMGPQYNVNKIIIAPDGRVFAKFKGMDGNIPLKRNPLEKAPQDNTTLTKVDTTSGKDNTTNEDNLHGKDSDIIREFDTKRGKHVVVRKVYSENDKLKVTKIEAKADDGTVVSSFHEYFPLPDEYEIRPIDIETMEEDGTKVLGVNELRENKRGTYADGTALTDAGAKVVVKFEDGSIGSLDVGLIRKNEKPAEQPHPSRKFDDGTEVPMTTDSKGRPTPDYEKMTPEQSAEILTEDFGDNAEKVVDGQIQKAEKALKDAEKMKVDYTAEPNDIMEQEALKKKTVEAAKKQLDHAQNIKKAMTAKKVAETVGKTEQTEGAHEAGSVAAQKFVNAPRLVGNKRTRMLPDGETKIKGHYEIVPAEGLTPSHDVNNGYKKSEGFPTDAEGRTVNDRDYEHDKAAQQNTDQIARKYNGMAIEQVPVVSDEGIVYDGNGRTMAGQKAAKDGTDGEYINDLLENAENFGFTIEQIEQSGIEHPRLVLVTDERLPYDTATFAKFNRNEKKTQSNTEQAVAKAKTLTSDEVGAIVAEIEGNGSLDAFFNNSKAINDLVKTLVDKGIIGQNEVAHMMDSPERLSAQGREYVKNLLLGSIFKPETIRMLGIDSTVKNKAINAIRSVMDNMKLGEFSLRDEIDQAIQLLYEARQGGNKVDTLLRTPDMYVEDAAKRYPSISQMMALALEGKVADFRDLLDEYNRIAAARNTGEGNVFGESPTKQELIKEFLDFKKWQDYGTGHSENERGNDVSGVEEPQQEASGGNEPAEAERPRVEEADDLENKELESRIEVTDEETETPSKYGPIMKQKIVIDGDKEVMKVDEPNKKGEYTGSYYEYDDKKFGDLNEVTKYIDSKNEEGPLPLLPKKENPDPTFNPIEAAAAEFKKEHPLTEEEIMKADVDDLSKDMALDYLNGEVTDDLHRAIYESIYAKRKGLKAEPKVENASDDGVIHNDNVQSHDWSKYKEGDIFDYDGFKVRFKFVERDENGNVTGVAVQHLDENGKPIENGGESVPPLMFMQGYTKDTPKVKSEVKSDVKKADDAAVAASNKKVNDLWDMLKNAGKDELSASFVGLNSKQLEVLPKLVSAMAENAYLRIKRGMHNLEDVVKEMRKEFAPAAKVFKKEDVDAIYEQMMNIRYRDGEQRMSLKDWADYYEKTSPKHQENLVGDSKDAEERKQKENSFINRIQTVLSMGEFKTGIAGMRKIAENCGLEGVKDTDLQELVETAVVGMARRYATSKAMSDDVKFAKIKLLYNRQPSLNQRDSERVMKQQYSTPAPYAFLADMYVKGNGKVIESALEPSAGNGMLTIGLPMDKVHVNDIDAQRLANLRRQGFKNVTSQDGTQPFADKDVDVVVTNPPFGSATPKEYDGYKISSLEGQMAINALESMKDDGRAAIIIGGKTEYAKNGSLNPKDKAFLGYLYSHYNVEDVINVDGSLYAKQGTSYPTRIILINGRRLNENAFPPVKDKARAETVKDYDELYKRIEDDIHQSAERGHGLSGDNRVQRPERGESNKPSVTAHDSAPNKERVRELGQRESLDKPSRNDRPHGAGMASESMVEKGGKANGGADGEIRPGDNGHKPGGMDLDEDKRRSDGGNVGGQRAEGLRGGDGSGNVAPRQRAKRQGLTTEKVQYVSKSRNPFSLHAVMPADQAEAVQKNLDKLGDVDQFLVDELGYNDKDDMYKALSSEQADSVALAINQMKQGNAFIIGDQTGIGKGRQGAALIRYAVKQGSVPVYLTQDAPLLSTVYRDTVDIGSKELRPFVIASDKKQAAITDQDGNLIYDLPSAAEKKRVFDYIKKYGKLPKEYDYVLTTYKQFASGTTDYENGERTSLKLNKGQRLDSPSRLLGQERRDVVEALMGNGYLILDECHNASGDSGIGHYFQHIVGKAKGVTFISATFAKRPDNMPIYAMRTAMSKAGMEASDLIEAIRTGGTTLQEIMSQTLTESGQMIRRERDMTGVSIDYVPMDEAGSVEEQKTKYDSIIDIFNDIIDFQKRFVDSYLDTRNEELADIQSTITNRKGTKALGIKNQPFASKTFNTVRQLLLGIKAPQAVKRAIECLEYQDEQSSEKGIKPIIFLENTMESNYKDDFENDVDMESPDFGTVLKKGLEGVLRYTQTDAKGKESKGSLSLADLGPEAEARYNEIMNHIAEVNSGMFISPIDYIKHELEKKGYRVGELTGREFEFVFNEDGTVRKQTRVKPNKKDVARKFNNGEIDVIIANKTGATGIDLHAGLKFKDQRPRRELILQNQLNIGDEVQAHGRADRTNQKYRGQYEYILSMIPAEQRLFMMLKSKLKSLYANTTSSQKSKFNEMEVADIINKYGDKVVANYLAEHLDIYSKLSDPLNWESTFGDDLSSIDPQKLIETKASGDAGSGASKTLQRMSLLKVSEQEKVIQEIGELYANEIQRLNEMGENDLEITELPLKAKTIRKEVWKQGSEPGGDNAFADNTYIEKVNMAILKKPMKAAEVKASQEGLTGGKTWEEYKTEKKTAVKEYFDQKIADETKKYEERAVKAATKAKEKYIKDAKKGQKDSGMSDEQIEKMAGYQYDNIYKQEKDKLNDVVKNLKAKAEMFDRVLDTFDTNSAFVLPSDMNNPNELSGFGNSYGRLIDIKITDNFSPNASSVSFATLDGRRKITFPIAGKVGAGDNKADVISAIDNMTKQAAGMGDSHLRVLNQKFDNWDRLTSNESRKNGYIVTGNLMQALVDSKDQGLGGQLVKYTTDTGEVKTGILMPDRFDPKGLTTDAPINSVAEKFELSSWHGGIDEVTSSDGEVKVKRIDNNRGNYYELRVPKSKAKGGKYFLDNDLLKLVDGNNFETRGNNMLAEFKPEQLKPVLDRLSKMGVKVQEERKTSEDEGTHFREDRGLQYSKTDTKDVKKGRIIPEDVDKTVSSQIEKRFDAEVERLYGDSSEKPNIEKEANKYAEKQYIDTFKYDKKGNPIQKYEGLKSVIDSLDSKLKDIEQKYGFNRKSDINEIKSAIGTETSEGNDSRGMGGVSQGDSVRISGRKGILSDYKETALSLAAAQRAKEYLLERFNNIRLKYGLEEGDWASKEQVERIFNDYNSDTDVKKIFDRIEGIVDVLGTKLKGEAYKKVYTEGYYYHPKNYILIDTDYLSSIQFSKQELASTICHEMLHVVTSDIINLYRKGYGDLLNERQRNAAKEVVDLYGKINSYFERHFEGAKPYALTNPAEMITELANPAWRRIAAQIPAAKGWFRSFIAAVRNMLGFPPKVSALDRLDKALENVIRNLDYGVFQKGAELNDEIVNKKVTDPEEQERLNKEKIFNYPTSSVESHVEKVAQKTGGKVKMLQSVEEVTNAEAKARLEKGEKVEGWYDERTGEVVLYMPNVHDSYTAEKTVWHEIVGHKGMRELFGNDNYDKFLDDIYFNLDKPEYADLKKLVMKELQYNPFDYRNAIEEAIARMAEEGHGEHGLWNNLKNKVANIFREIGYRVAPNTKDIKYLLWLAKNYSKHPESDGYFAIRRNALLHKLERDNTPSIVERNGMFFDNDGKDHDYLLDLNHKDFEEATDGKVHFRTSPMTASKIEEYNRRLGTKLYAFKESTVDHMQSLQEAMEIISGEKNAWTDIPSAFNPLQAQNRIDSIVQQKAEEYDRKYTKPLDDSFKKVVSTMSGSDKDEQLRNAQLYMITKHGLERNRVFFVRDAIRDIMNDDVTKAKTLMKDWNDKQKDLADELEKGNIRFDEYLEQMDEWIRSNVDINFVADEHDYSGFHGMQNIAKTSDPYDDKLAIDNVMSAESQMGSDLAKDFWIKKKAATDYVIDQEYYNGFIDQSDRDYLKGMFQWYVPLRKFDDTTAEDVYGYIGEKGDPSNFVGPVLANAKGRSSLSDINVMAQISAMAKSSLINGGKNVVKQHFARFVSAYETGNTKDKIFVEVNPWLEKHVVDGNEVWEEVTPQIPENATQQQISNILQNFEDTMQAKKATGDAKLSRRNPNIGFKFQRAKNKSEHIVDVYIAGKKRSFVCQGNPRAAQALNGLVKDSGTRNVATRFDAKITRKIAQFNTSLNPDFMMSNMLRDLTFASANVTKEGFAYTKDFLKEYAGNIISIKNGKGSGNYLTMFRKYRDGKLDINNERERMFKEFMDNGGQTGFVQIKKLESLIDEYDNLIKKGSKDADGWFVKKIKEGGTFIETANEIIENVARYSTYCTSRKHGRSVGRSIYDAKEVSTNFNRHGSGDAIRKLKTSTDSNIDKIFRRSLGFFNSWMKNHTQFYNAGVQGANLFFKNYKSAWKTTAVSFGMLPLGLGIAQALINQFLINNEDEKDRKGVKDPYAELPEWKRRNNICIYTGHGNFKTIPIAIELRAFFGLGDIAAGYVVNDKLKSSTPIGYDILGQMAQLVPASDFLGHHSPSSSIKELGEDALLAVTPTTISPAMELGFNRDWTGRPFYRDYDYLDKAPRWKRAYDNTNDIYMSINKWANQGTNGIDSSNADMKGNETLDYLTAPYAWQHLIDSYTGGMGSTIGRTYKTLEAIGKGVVSGAKNEEGFSKGFSDEFEKFDKNQIPLYRVFNYTPKEGQDMQRTRSKWYNYSDELKQTEYNIKQLKTNTPDVLKNMENNAKKFNFTHGEEGKAYNIWKAADSYISKKKKQLNKASNPEVIKSINEDINRKMQEAVNDLDKLN